METRAPSLTLLGASSATMLPDNIDWSSVSPRQRRQRTRRRLRDQLGGRQVHRPRGSQPKWGSHPSSGLAAARSAMLDCPRAPPTGGSGYRRSGLSLTSEGRSGSMAAPRPWPRRRRHQRIHEPGPTRASSSARWTSIRVQAGGDVGSGPTSWVQTRIQSIGLLEGCSFAFQS